MHAEAYDHGFGEFGGHGPRFGHGGRGWHPGHDWGWHHGHGHRRRRRIARMAEKTGRLAAAGKLAAAFGGVQALREALYAGGPGRPGPGHGGRWDHGGHALHWGPWGRPFPWGAFWGRRGPRMGRGDVRTAILALLAEQPMHGYQIIQEITARSEGAWRPSPGSVYPTLQQLEDEGLVEAEKVEGRRVMRLTDAGRAWVDEHGEEVAAVWRAVTEQGDERVGSLFGQLAQVAGAVVQVSQAGSRKQMEEATRLLAEVRGKLYRLLAEDGPDDIRRV